MPDNEKGLKHFLLGILQNAIWDGVKKAIGGGAVSALGVAVYEYLRHRSIDWWGILALFIFTIFILTWRTKSSRKTTSKDEHTQVSQQLRPPEQRILESPLDAFSLESLKTDALETADQLLAMLDRLGPAPLPKYTKEQLDRMSSAQRDTLLRSDDGDYAEACEFYDGGHWFQQTEQAMRNKINTKWIRLLPWFEKVRASYDLRFASTVEQLRNRFTIEGILSDDLRLTVFGKDSEATIRIIALKLRELAYKVGEKGGKSENA